MRPQSIVMFERLFLASLVVSAISFVVGYDQIMRVVAADPAMQQFGLGSGFVIGTFVASTALYLLLWYLIAHRASTVAKWILVVFTVLGVVSVLSTFGGPLDLSVLLALAVYALEVAALVCLFRTDAKAWFKGEPAAKPETLD